MQLSFEKKKDTLFVRITGELDLHTADQLRQNIDRYLKDYTVLKNIIMDLQGIEFIDSSGLGVILGRYKLLQQRGGKMGAVSVSSQVKRIFELAGMLKLISIYEYKEQAEDAFGISGY